MLLFSSQLVSFKGAYDINESYNKGDIVVHQDRSYISLQENKGNPISNTNYWAPLNEAFIINDSNLNSTNTTLSASKIVNNQNTDMTNSQNLALSDLTDVDLITSPPVNDNVLTFENGKWIPKMQTTGGALTIEDWVQGDGETVELLDETPPGNVMEITVTKLDRTSLVLNWMEVASPTIKDYTIYSDSTRIATVPATTSKLQPLSYQLSSLNPATTYTFTIKARDDAGNESTGTSISIRTHGNYSILMNGTTDYVKLPSLVFDTIELTCMAKPGPIGVWYYFLDARVGVSTGYFAVNGNGNVQHSSVWSKILINDEAPNNINQIKNNKATIALSLSSPATDDINIFSDYKNNFNMAGKIYTVKILNNNHVIAYYNFTEQFAGASIPDVSGNGHTATLIGGTWVNES